MAPSVGVKAGAVVLHLDQQIAVGLADSHAHPIRLGVLGDVVEGFLQDAEDRQLHLGRHLDLQAEAHIPFPREAVFAVFRDELDRLVPFLPSIRSIRIAGREERGALVDTVIEWQAGADMQAFTLAQINAYEALL